MGRGVSESARTQAENGDLGLPSGRVRPGVSKSAKQSGTSAFETRQRGAMTIDYRRPVETALPQPHRTRVSSDAEGAPIRVAATATALPEHVLDREGSRAYLQKVSR